MSTSSAPCCTASFASAALTLDSCLPLGKPHTVATFTPFETFATAVTTKVGDTQTE